jgi:hypothetical protein
VVSTLVQLILSISPAILPGFSSLLSRSGRAKAASTLGVLAPFHRISKRLVPFGFGEWPLLDFEDVLVRPWTRHEAAVGRSTKIHVIREFRGIKHSRDDSELIGAMDDAQRCRDQAAECLRLVKLAQSKHEAEVLRNISSSWLRLAGQIDRYNALVRERGRIIRK